ncbi:MAG: hypothetical protein KGP12_09950 [Actinomycetales bacterium]|nr:hypothetical protein [Actinomycetales bacterium]
MTSDVAERLLAHVGLPAGDLHDRPSSTLTFEDGGHYRVEIPSVEGFDAVQAAVDEAVRLDVPLHRLSSGSGISLTSDSELRDIAQLGAERAIEICPFVGPKAPWDGDTAMALAPDGRTLGWRHAGMDQLRYALKDVDRAVKAGYRSVLLADEGLIHAVARGRKLGYFPDDLVIKGSALLGIGNAASVRILRELGLDSLNVPGDLSLAKLAAVRAASDVVIDLYVESPDSLGGFLRYHDIPEIVRVSSPVYLKFGLRNAASIYPSGVHLSGLADASTRERVRRARVGLEHLDRAGTSAAVSPVGAMARGIPKP